MVAHQVFCSRMRRFARLLFTLCSALLLMLMGWSFLVSDAVEWRMSRTAHSGKSLGVTSRSGRVTFYTFEWATPVDMPVGGVRLRWYSQPGQAGDLDPINAVLGFGLEHRALSPKAGVPRFSIGYRALAVPHLLLVVATAVPFLLGILRERAAWMRFARWYRGRCVSCGYDLRASPERCPECGAAAR